MNPNPSTHSLVTMAVAIAVAIVPGRDAVAEAQRAIAAGVERCDGVLIASEWHPDPTVIFGDGDGSLELPEPWGDA